MTRLSNKLSVKFCEKRLEPGLYGDGNGLYLQVSAFRTKAWIFRFMIRGRARKMGLGDFDRLSLAEARKKAQGAYAKVVDGVDPIDARNALRTAQAAEQVKFSTFKQCALQCIADRAQGWKGGEESKSWKQWVSTLESYVYPTIGSLSVADIDLALVLKIIKPIWQTKTETADRVRNRIEIILDWARVHGYRSGDNPARWRGFIDQVLQSPGVVTPVESFPALPYKEIPVFMARLRQRESISARALEFTVLTAMRTGSVIGAKRLEIDAQAATWTIPASTLKGRKGSVRKDHIVPLSGRAIELLKDLPENGNFLFPGGIDGEGLSNMAMSEFLDGMGYPPAVATVHGFRSSFKDWAMETTDYPHEMSEIALAHKISDKVDAAYRRGDMLAKRRGLMNDWTAYCGEQETIVKKSNVDLPVVARMAMTGKILKEMQG